MTEKRETQSLLRYVEEAKYALTDEGRRSAINEQRKRADLTARESIE